MAFENALDIIQEGGTDLDDRDLEEALNHGRTLVEGLKLYSKGNPWATEGKFLLKLAEVEYILGLNEICLQHLYEAEDILRVSLGVDCPQVLRIRQLKEELESTRL